MTSSGLPSDGSQLTARPQYTSPPAPEQLQRQRPIAQHDIVKIPDIEFCAHLLLRFLPQFHDLELPHL